MPISRALALVACLGLAACEGGFGPGGVQSLAVAGGAVTVAGPRVYCVDRRLTRDGPAEAFVVMGSCAALTRGGAQPVGAPSVLTATVAPTPGATLPPPAELERFLRSEAGRAALARNGQPGNVRILQTQARDGILYLYIRDTSAAAEGPPTDPAYWRAVLVLNGRLVTATVLAFADQPLSADRGFRKLGDFVARLRAANSGAPS